jgi:hypothetical protein
MSQTCVDTNGAGIPACNERQQSVQGALATWWAFTASQFLWNEQPLAGTAGIPARNERFSAKD